MYTTAQEAGITLITISHKPSLWKYHTLLLKIGEGSGEEWVLENITSSNTLIESVEVEIAKIRNEVEGIATLKKRLLEINRELGLDVDIDDEGAKVAVKRNTI